MKRSKSTLLKKGGRQREAQAAKDVAGDSFAEAMQEHRQSNLIRPKSAGTDRRSRMSFWYGSKIKDLKHLPFDEAMPNVGDIMEFRTGRETFQFPVPSPSTPKSAQYTVVTPALPFKADPSLIGIALGSPSHPPPSFGRSFTADHISPRMTRPRRFEQTTTAMPEESFAEPSTPRANKRKSGWKAFSNIFRTKPSKDSPEPLPPLPSWVSATQSGHSTPRPPTKAPISNPSPGDTVRSHSTIGRYQHTRTPSWTRGQARAEARGLTDIATFMPQHEPQMGRATPQQLDITTSPHMESPSALHKAAVQPRHDSPIDLGPPQIDFALRRPPRLNIDLPSPEMERYSVMFGNVLGNEPKLSLLERRQEKLRTNSPKDGDRISPTIGPQALTLRETGVPQRSKTSPHLQRLASLTIKVDGEELKKSSEASNTAFHRPRPQRSNTAPASSPVRATSTIPRDVPVVNIVPAIMESSSDSPLSGGYNESPKVLTPATIATTHPHRSWFDADRDSSEFDLEVLTVAPLRIRRPVPKSATKPDGTPQSVGSPQPVKKPNDLSKPLPTAKPLPAEPIHELQLRGVQSNESLGKQIVQVAVARQVSVSRARARVPRALSSKQPMKPKVVELSKDSRNSTMVVLEGGD